MRSVRQISIIILLLCLAMAACAKKQGPVTAPAPPPNLSQPQPTTGAGAGSLPPATPTQRVEETLPVPQEPISEESIGNRSLDDLNRDSPFQPVFFPLDASDLDEQGRTVVSANASILKKYPSWVLTLEGHCDERGTAEYNIALGERRAIAVKTYLVSLGIAQDRLRTVSYGKEFPFEPGHDEGAWSKNRRAHFVITAK